MSLPSLQVYRSLHTLSSPTDSLLAERALTLLKRYPYQLNSISPQITPQLASYLLLQTQNDRNLTLKFINFAKPHQFFNPHCKCIALHILTKFKLYKTAQNLAQDLAVNTADEKAGNLEMGLRFFEEMDRNGCLPNVVTYNTVIGAYCKLKRIDEAFKLLRSMGLKGLEPNLLTYNMVINGLCREGRIEETSGVLAEMGRKGFAPDEVTYNTLVNGYCKVGNFHQALVLHSEMLRNGLSPDVVTYTSLINTMCKAGNLNRAMGIFDQMHVRGLCPNGVTYTSLINGFSQKGFMDEAYRIWDEMIRSGFPPTVVTYNALLNGHCVSGRMEEAIGLLREMEGKARTKEAKRLLLKLFYDESIPNGITYDTLIESCSNIEFKSAVALIKGFCMKGLMNEADQVFEFMIKRNQKPNEAVYNVIIHGHCRDGNVQKAHKLYKEMIDFGFIPHTVTIIALVKALYSEGMDKQLNLVIRNILRSCKLSDAELSKVLVQINHKEGNIDAVFNLLAEMARDGFLPSGATPANAGQYTL
ncbi:hypothetical protein OIU74_009235 [Salix koriyanagi]|uniref:Pentatricopeptide repeat-containing protein n=1 Tax=Salix koriyanagi TaxID=2511006 RepID=A0A9Q0TS57_9ROSI|nr:hypothetical protein OIU74_009235 [Salix koriyanagi]